MTSTNKAGQAARQKARERRIALEAQTKARNDRIENWTTEVFTGAAERDRALQAVASAEDAIADGLIGLVGEGLAAATIAALCDMPAGDVRKLIKRRRGSGARGSRSSAEPPRGGYADGVSNRSRANVRPSGETPASPPRQSRVGATDE